MSSTAASPVDAASAPKAPLARYRAQRLATPIALPFGFGFQAMRYGLAPGLAIASLVAAVMLEGPGRAVGLFGLVFFGGATALLWVAARRADGGAALRIGEDGLFLAHVGLTLPWSRLGPAFVMEAEGNHGVARQTVILLREPGEAMTAADPFGRVMLGLARRAAARVGEPKSWGGEILSELVAPAAADPDAALATLEARLERLRRSRVASGATPVAAPPALTGGVTPEALAAMLNAEILARAPAPTPTDPETSETAVNADET